MPSWHRNSRNYLTVVPFSTSRVLCWKHIFTGNTLWQVPETSGWLCGKVGNVGHFCVLLWEMLFWIKSCWISKCSLCILTLWSTFIISSLLMELKICYHWCQCLLPHTNLSQLHPSLLCTTYFPKCVPLLSSQMAFVKEVSPAKILYGSFICPTHRRHLKSVSTILNSLHSSQCLPSHNIQNFTLIASLLAVILSTWVLCEHLVLSPHPPPLQLK